MPFYTELPTDVHGNRSHTNSGPLVIEAEALEVALIGLRLVVKATPIIFPWPRVYPDEWIEVDGPTRILTEREYVSLLQSAKAPDWAIKAAESRL